MNNLLTQQASTIPRQLLIKIKKWKTEFANNIFLLNSIEHRHSETLAEELIFGILLIKSAGKIFNQLKISSCENLFNQLLLKLKDLNELFHTSLFGEILNSNIKIDEEILYKIFEQTEIGESLNEFLIPETYGVIYEYLKYSGATSDSSGKIKRKTGGVYYTPVYIADYIIENTIGKKLSENSNANSAIKIYDPACGSGIFILRAYDFLLKSILPNEAASFEKKKEIILNSIFGTDFDHNAIEVTKFSLLMKLIDGSSSNDLPDLSQNFDCINFLFDETPLFDHFSGKFDVIIGNPPYSAELDERERKILKKNFNLGTTDTAALFMSVAKEKLKSGGINGFIIPKPFVYSSNWKKLREKFLPGITALIDCGKVWKEVKLEQVIYFYMKDKNFNFYFSGIRKEKEISISGQISKDLYNDFELLLNGITEDELKIGLKIRMAGLFLNDLTTNHRGAPLQESLLNEESDFKVIGGKQIQRFKIKGFKGYFPLEKLIDSKAIIKDNSVFVQNIVAHVQKPEPAIKIIAAVSGLLNTKNYLILDTINQLQNKSSYSSLFICAVLNSKLISWYVYNFIFGRAIRTMHFDNYVTRRIPFPKIDLNNSQNKKIYEQIIELAEILISPKNERKSEGKQSRTVNKISNEIELLVQQFYNISEAERKTIYTEGI